MRHSDRPKPDRRAGSIIRLRTVVIIAMLAMVRKFIVIDSHRG